MRGPVLKGSQVRLGTEVFPACGDAAARRPEPDRGGSDDREPIVHFEQEGDVIRAIHITCSCGKEMDLECVYDPEQDDGDAPGAVATDHPAEPGDADGASPAAG